MKIKITEKLVFILFVAFFYLLIFYYFRKVTDMNYNCVNDQNYLTILF
jgi:hypothetical protein